MKTATLLLMLILAGCTMSSITSFKSEYDKFKDVTIIKSREVGLPLGFMSGSGAMQAVTACRGNSKCLPDTVQLFFHTMNDHWMFIDNHSLRLIVDAERIDLGKTRWDGSPGKYVYEYMHADIPTELLRKIANANRVEFQLGSKEFEISHEERGVFREFLTKAAGH